MFAISSMDVVAMSTTVIKRIKYGTQRISARINAVMSVNIKYCILRPAGSHSSNCAGSNAAIYLSNASCEMPDEEIALPTVVAN